MNSKKTPLHRKKSHWEEYRIYYLFFGTFSLSLLFIFIVNHSTNEKIEKLTKQLERHEENASEVREILRRINK